MFNLTPVVRILLLVNIVLFAIPYLFGVLLPLPALQDMLNSFLGTQTSVGSGLKQSMVLAFGLFKPWSEYFHFWQVITAPFLHSDLMHLVTNMLGLIIFGPWVETSVGSDRFRNFYLASAIGASLIYMGTTSFDFYHLKQDGEVVLAKPTPDNLANFMAKYDKDRYKLNYKWFRAFDDDRNNEVYIAQTKEYVTEIVNHELNTPMIGASGAIMAIMLAFALLFPNVQLMLLFPPIPIKAKYLAAGYVLYDLYRAIQNASNDNVAHYAHLGGALFGWIFVVYWKRNHLARYYE